LICNIFNNVHFGSYNRDTISTTKLLDGCACMVCWPAVLLKLKLVPSVWLYKEYWIHGWQEIHCSICAPNIVIIDEVLTKLLQNKMVQFFCFTWYMAVEVPTSFHSAKFHWQKYSEEDFHAKQFVTSLWHFYVQSQDWTVHTSKHLCAFASCNICSIAGNRIGKT